MAGTGARLESSATTLTGTPSMAMEAINTLVLAVNDIHPGLRAGDAGARLVTDKASLLRLLRRSRPLVLVLCVPPATADEIAAVARERRLRRDMRAVLIDQPEAAGERLTALRAGFDEALDARVSETELAGRLALLAEEARRSRGENRLPIAVGLELDLDAHELRLRGKAVHLRPREYELLEVLARHPGRTFTRRQLLEAVGARDSIRDLRTIDVHVRWLRAKLHVGEERGARLVTVRGVGYRLDRGASSGVDNSAPVNRTLTNRERDVDGRSQD